ncbi:MAG: hypothetical protein ACR2NM_02050, partial [Bythopirellula sp.]
MTTQTTIFPRIALQHERVAPRAQTRPTTRTIEIAPVRSQRDVAEFIDLPKRLHRADPHWVAPLDMQVKSFLDRRRHPFYQHGQAEAFLAKRDGQTVGRILASDDPLYNQAHGTQVGCFGLLETIDDLRTCRALLDAASRWLVELGRT